MRKLKICIISAGAFPDHKDGSANYIRGLYDALKSRGHDLTMLTAKWGDGFNDKNIITVDVPKRRILWVPKFYFKFRKYIKTHDFDIIQGNGSRGSLPVMFTKKPYITLIHDMGPFEADFTKIPILKWLERRNANKAKQIITNSEITKTGIIEIMGGSKEKIHTVYCGYDPSFKPQPKRAKELKQNLGIEGPVIYYVGRIAFYKGVDHIIEAYYHAKKEIPKLNLVIGGKPTLKMKDTVEKWKKENPDVNFVGLVKEEDMSTYYSMGDVFVTYSFASEGFGITPVESIACGTPVICSTMPAYQEILQDNAIFVERQRPDLLAKAFIDFFHHPEKNQEMMTKATEFIKRYTWDAVADRVEKVYENFLQGK
ncbi:glycosyltransferase family 4 protein [Promethearchaeum syntrophicum]|uniref:Glycosyltransferase family 4 protein n=1 Tax=Promethearchaeum syntrophicum TaxID=2594042 RepID=A0A5B9DA29_9ARCH|nr:glycosyltransferase family 4 protein [Candidatus Prometheoarchaeum syntrophicum]QEE16004.1 Trehalose synthase [Candidatus Prometheoarchaeum syntrophicum]